jgi:hypothetical protein
LPEVDAECRRDATVTSAGAAGEFLHLGPSKTVTGTRFAKLETGIYRPFRVFLAAASGLAAWPP